MPIHDIIHYSTSIRPLEPGKCGKERENYKNLNFLRTKKGFQIKLKKKHFPQFLKGYHLVKKKKKKKLIKIADTSFKVNCQMCFNLTIKLKMPRRRFYLNYFVKKVPIIWTPANQWTCFYIIGISVIKGSFLTLSRLLVWLWGGYMEVKH